MFKVKYHLGKFGNINPIFGRFSFINPTYDIFFNNPTFTTQRILLGLTCHKPVVAGNMSLHSSTLSRYIQSSSSIHHHLVDFFTDYRPFKPNKSCWVIKVGLLKNMSQVGLIKENRSKVGLILPNFPLKYLRKSNTE